MAQSVSTSDTEASSHSSRQLMTASSPHLAMFGYQRTLSAPPAASAGSQPSLVGVDPGPAGQAALPPASHLPPPSVDMRPHTISSSFDGRHHTRSALSAATFEPPQPLREHCVASAVLQRSLPCHAVHLVRHHRPPLGPCIPPPAMGRSQRDEVIYQSVLRTPGSPKQLQQHAVDNGAIYDAVTGILFLAIFDICSGSFFLYATSRYNNNNNNNNDTAQYWPTYTGWPRKSKPLLLIIIKSY